MEFHSTCININIRSVNISYVHVFLLHYFHIHKIEKNAPSWSRKNRAVAILSLPGGQDKNISSILPHFPIFSHIFRQFSFIFFLNLAFRVGNSPTREGPGYATGKKKKTKKKTKTKTKQKKKKQANPKKRKKKRKENKTKNKNNKKQTNKRTNKMLLLTKSHFLLLAKLQNFYLLDLTTHHRTENILAVNPRRRTPLNW